MVVRGPFLWGPLRRFGAPMGPQNAIAPVLNGEVLIRRRGGGRNTFVIYVRVSKISPRTLWSVCDQGGGRVVENYTYA